MLDSIHISSNITFTSPDSSIETTSMSRLSAQEMTFCLYSLKSLCLTAFIFFEASPKRKKVIWHLTFIPLPFSGVSTPHSSGKNSTLSYVKTMILSNYRSLKSTGSRKFTLPNLVSTTKSSTWLNSKSSIFYRICIDGMVVIELLSITGAD